MLPDGTGAHWVPTGCGGRGSPPGRAAGGLPGGGSEQALGEKREPVGQRKPFLITKAAFANVQTQGQHWGRRGRARPGQGWTPTLRSVPTCGHWGFASTIGAQGLMKPALTLWGLRAADSSRTSRDAVAPWVGRVSSPEAPTPEAAPQERRGLASQLLKGDFF